MTEKFPLFTIEMFVFTMGPQFKKKTIIFFELFKVFYFIITEEPGIELPESFTLLSTFIC